MVQAHIWHVQKPPCIDCCVCSRYWNVLSHKDLDHTRKTQKWCRRGCTSSSLDLVGSTQECTVRQETLLLHRRLTSQWGDKTLCCEKESDMLSIGMNFWRKQNWARSQGGIRPEGSKEEGVGRVGRGGGPNLSCLNFTCKCNMWKCCAFRTKFGGC